VAARRVAEMIATLEAEIGAKSAEQSERLATMLSAVKAFDRLQKMQEREGRAIASLATKMRISQQATTNHRGNKIESRKPWEV
jgi:cell division protein ZapA (FtsZ GTPase activity inhibitor)